MGKKGFRGQLTAFMILGLMFVILVSLVLYLRFGTPSQELLPLIPREARPVYDVVDGCVQIIGQESIARMGLQGGYLVLPEDIEHTPTSYLPMDDRAGLKVPYWYFNAESRVPSISRMEAELALEIMRRLPDCLGNFSALQPRWIIEPTGDLGVNVTIARDNVLVRTEYPVSWEDGQTTYSWSEFVSSLDVRLSQMWGLASKTLDAENSGEFLENTTIALMAMDPNVPFTGMTFDCAKRRWSVPDVRNTLKETLRVNLPSVRIKKTAIVPFERPDREYEALKDYAFDDIMAGNLPSNVPPDAYEYLKLYWDVGADESDLRPALIYEPSWGMSMSASPNDNGVLESTLQRGAGVLGFFCVNVHHFTYDLVYPVLFRVRDTKAFGGKGATFQMAMPVIIRTNSPARDRPGTSTIIGPLAAEGFCEQLGDVVDLRATGFEADEPIASELREVEFTFDCMGRICELGKSEADSGVYRLRAALPAACANPVITASKPGYLDRSVQVDGDSVTIPLRRVRNLPLEVIKVPYDLATGQISPAVPLSSLENVSVRITLSGKKQGEAELDGFVVYPANATVKLLEGKATYDVTLLLMRGDDLVGGYVAENVVLDGSDDKALFAVIEGQPVGTDNAYRTRLATVIYGTDYQSLLEVQR